jgi:UDP-GlcNAc3NAcA epimerase
MPEEINRLVADAVSDLLFAPTQTAVANLAREGVRPERIRMVGDVMFDAALHYGEQANTKRALLHKLGLADRPYVLATIHRAENVDDLGRLRIIFDVLVQLSRDLPVVLPLHPRARKMIDKNRIEPALHQLLVIEPLGYLQMLLLEKHAALIATDSGGVQKEAFFFRVPCVTFREETEWSELVALGWNRLAPPTDISTVLEACRQALDALPDEHANPYGDGRAAERIAQELIGTWAQPMHAERPHADTSATRFACRN